MSGSSFFDALTDPAVDALLGMSQGFAQAAMPQRMPTPWGAAIGMGLGGALPGVAAGQSLQKSGIENQRAKMLMDWYHQNYGGGAGTPFGAPVAGGAGGGAGGSAASANPYLRSPSQIAAMGDLAMATNNDRAASTLYGMTNTMAGGPGYAISSDGVHAFAVPGGVADPHTVYQKELATQTAGVGPAIAKAGGIKNVEAPFTPPTQYDVPDLNPDGSQHLDAQGNPTFHKQLMTPMQANSTVNGGGGGDGAPVAATPSPFPGWAKQIIGGVENPGGNPTAKNPQSTATGNGQFTEGTWPAVIRAGRPDLAAGKTDAQLMALRNDPGVAQDATEQYARQNGAALAQAGYQVNGPTIAMAHGLGPAGAISVLQKRDDTPVAAFMPKAVIDANPYLQNGATVADVKRFYAGRMGYGGGQPAAAPQDQPQQPYKVAQATAPGGSVVPPPSVPATPPRAPVGVVQPGIAGPQVLTPQQQADLTVQTAGREAKAKAEWVQETQNGVPGLVNKVTGEFKPTVTAAPRPVVAPDGTVLAGIPGTGRVDVVQPANNPGVAARTSAAAQGTKTGEAAALTPSKMFDIGREADQAIGNIDYGMNQLHEAAKGGINSGYFAPWLATGAAAFKSLGVDLNRLGIEPAAVGNVQSAQKTLGVVAGTILQNTIGKDSQITDSKIEHFIHTQPGIETDPQAIERIMNWARSQFVYNRDMAMDAMQNTDENGMLSPGWKAQFVKRKGAFAPIYDPTSQEMKQPSGEGPAAAPPAATPAAQPETAVPPVAGARRAPDGNWYVEDPKRPGKYLMVH